MEKVKGQQNDESRDDDLEEGLEESMAGSDTPSDVQPGSGHRDDGKNVKRDPSKQPS